MTAGASDDGYVIDPETARTLYEEGIRIMRDEPDKVLQGGMNKSLGMDTESHGKVLVRVPKLGVMEPFEHVWPEPVILRAMRHIEETPGILYATPGWERSAGHFQIHQFAVNTRPMPAGGMTTIARVPDHVVDNDLPVYSGKVARLDNLPPPAKAPATNARDSALRRLAQFAAQWEHSARRFPGLLGDVGLPERFEDLVRPVWRPLSELTDVPLAPVLPDVWRGNMLLRDDETVFLDTELLTIDDPRSALGYQVVEGRYPEDQEARLVERSRVEVGIPGRGFDDALKGWSGLQVLVRAERFLRRRSLAIRDRIELGASEAQIAQEIAYFSPGNAVGVGAALELLGRDAPPPEVMAWAYRREHDRVMAELRESGRRDVHRKRAPTSMSSVIPANWKPSGRVMEYASGALTDNPRPAPATRSSPINAHRPNPVVAMGLPPMRAVENPPDLGIGGAYNSPQAGEGLGPGINAGAEQTKANELKLARSLENR